MWTPLIYEMKEIALNSKVQGNFIYSGDKKIASVSTSCGCTTTRTSDNELSFTYTAPTSFLGTGDRMDVSKVITVTYDDLTKDHLTIRGFVKRPVV